METFPVVFHLLAVIVFPQKSVQLLIGQSSCWNITNQTVPDRPYLTSTIAGILHDLHWSTVVYLHDGEAGIDMVHGIKGLMYDISKLNIHATLQEVNRALFPNMKIVVTVSRRRLARLMSQVDMFDERSNRTTDFRHHSQWLLLTTGADLKQLNITQLENVAAILTDKLTYHNCEARLIASWLMTLRHHHQTSLFTAVSDCGASYKEACIFPNTAYGYNGRQVIVSILGTPFYVYKDIVNGTATFTGYCMDILEAIGRKLNFSFHMTEPADMTWGFIENRKWNGLVGQLHRREVDMVASDLTVHEGRAKVVDYIFPMIKTDALVILYKEPSGTENSFFLLTRPLSPIVTVVYLSVVLVLPVIMLLLESVQPNSRNKQKTRKASRVRRCMGIGWDIVGSLFKQAAAGRGVGPRSSAGKALLASWWLLVVIMTSTYCANLIAALSAQTRQPPFLNLNELVDSDYDVGMITSGISFSILQTSERPDVQRLLGKMKKFQEEDPLLVTNDEDMHIERVRRGKYAYICYELSARRYIREDCSLAYLNERLSWEHLAFAVPKDFPLKQDIDRVMSSLWESGVLDVLWKMWNPEENLTCLTERQQKPITLREVEGGLLIVCGGIALAAIALLVEWTKHKLSSCN